MVTIFGGELKNLLNGSKNENITQHITTNLRKSNLGLSAQAADTNPVTTYLDSFDLTKNISDLLSPACGMTEEEKQSFFNKIMAKLKSGKKLTPEEMRFLQAEYPALYPQAARIQAMRDGVETRLKTATSKQKAHEIYADALSHVADNDPMKEYIVAAYNDAMKNFQKTEDYQELPETEENAKCNDFRKRITTDIHVEYNDTCESEKL